MTLFRKHIETKEQEFRRFFDTNYDRIFCYAHHLLRDQEQARDIASAVFCQIWESYHDYDMLPSPSTLLVYTRNRCYDSFRHEQTVRKYEAAALKTIEHVYTDSSEIIEMDKLVRKMLDTLKEPTRYILEQCFLNKKKYAEVAEELNVHKDTIKRHIMKALKFLRENKQNFAEEL
ncbi:MAG: sigma-70 family RNA polymerase sigma factor [Bacteroidaceae bacterium]|nr:sigma-70 family RNA polymerase sigma factor [Bacteroidaceae bacterium]